MSGTVTVGTIFKNAGKAYRKQHRLPHFQQKAMSAIEQCRTSALGGRVDRCENCGYERVYYNSCRNRHCPNCQGLARKKWVKAREQELLPIPYFHVVFTLPDELNRVALINQREVYHLLFRAASATLLDLGRDKRHLGGQIGMIAVLHTWGQTLMDHPHLHCIVTGGGISNDDFRWAAPRWVQPKKQTAKRDFFVHVNVISDLFKKKFLDYLKRQYRDGSFKWVGSIGHLQDKRAFQKLLDRLYAKKWVTYCKRPFGGPEQVIRYLGHYTHRVALSNQRILSYANDQVTFSWKDYRDSGQRKQMTLAVDEFIRRFLLHILPNNFYRIRYYGLFANRDRKTKLCRCRELLGINEATQTNELSRKKFDIVLLELCGVDIWQCPKCENGRMLWVKSMTEHPP